MSSSIWLAMSTWPIPSDSGILWASGNVSICKTQGFFTQFGISSAIYNVSLSFYYLMAIKYSWKDLRLFKWATAYHGLPLGWGLGTAIAGISLDIFHSANLWCWIGKNPSAPSQDVNVYRMSFFYGPLWISIFIVTVNLILVFIYVREITLRSERYTSAWINVTPSGAIDSSSGTNGDDLYRDQGFATDFDFEIEAENKSNQNSEQPVDDARVQHRRMSLDFSFAKRRREVAMQSLRFAVSFYLTWIPISSVRILQMMEKPVPYALLLCAAIMTPMQGLPNFLVYLFPLVQSKWKASRTKRFAESEPEAAADRPNTGLSNSYRVEMTGQVQSEGAG